MKSNYANRNAKQAARASGASFDELRMSGLSAPNSRWASDTARCLC